MYFSVWQSVSELVSELKSPCLAFWQKGMLTWQELPWFWENSQLACENTNTQLNLVNHQQVDCLSFFLDSELVRANQGVKGHIPFNNDRYGLLLNRFLQGNEKWNVITSFTLMFFK